MEIDKYLEFDEFDQPDLSQIINSLQKTLSAVDSKAAYYNKLLDEPRNQAFVEAFLEVLGKRDDLSWDLYALRSIDILTYPTSLRTTIVAGQTAFYSTEYERYSRPTKDIWLQTFKLAGYDCVRETDRGFTVNNLNRSDTNDVLGVYNLLDFTDAPPLVQR